MRAEDANLLARVAGGDLGHPLEELYDRYAGRLYGLGLRLLGDPGLAEELVQETFVRLWQSAGTTRSAGRRPASSSPSPGGSPSTCSAGHPPGRSPSWRPTRARHETRVTPSTSSWWG
jgi:hypothetical protein